ncbi:MAG TPA: hypothetical protein VK559_04530 [Ferruginibacter sp.]|nr:hypothetical protein [Ferruginibacter sp.]
MDFLLRKKREYKIGKPLETTINELTTLFNKKKKWYTLSKTIKEKKDAKGEYGFKSDFKLFNMITIRQTVYLEGQIRTDEKGSVIDITFSPSIWTVLIIYIFPLLSLNILFGNNSFFGNNISKEGAFLGLLIFEVFFLTTALIPVALETRKFEKIVRKLKDNTLIYS